MINIATRQLQLVPLTHAQVDSNFQTLAQAIQAAYDQNSQLSITLQSPSGSQGVGYKYPSLNSFATSIAEAFARRVNLWDFMTPDMRNDASTGNPQLDHSSAYNNAVLELGGSGYVEIPRKMGAVYLLKDTVHLGSSNTVDSQVKLIFEPGTKVLSTLPNINDVLFSLKNVPGHFNNQGIQNLHVVSTNGNGVAIKFNGQCFGNFTDNYIEGFNVGRWFSNEGNKVFNEFIRFTNNELHLCKTGTLMSKDGDVAGTDTSMHGIVDRNLTVNVGDGQVGLQTIDICWYNADFDMKFFCSTNAQATIKMSTSGDPTNKGVFGSGSISCEGPAKLVGVGRFYFPTGFANFDVGVTDTLDAPVTADQGFMCANYIRSRAFGTSGYTVAELKPKASEYESIGPSGSMARLRKSGVESIVAVCQAPHATVPGNMLWTAYVPAGMNYESAVLGHGFSSDGTEITTKTPVGTAVAFTHSNGQYAFRYNGTVLPNTTEGILLGSGAAGVYSGIGDPTGVVPAGVGSTYQRRDGAAGGCLLVKESTGTAGWARAFTGKLASQSDSTATDIATLKADFNALLSKLRAVGLM